jgi:hypothetical protein
MKHKSLDMQAMPNTLLIQNDMEQGDALFPLLYNSALEHATSKIK